MTPADMFAMWTAKWEAEGRSKESIVQEWRLIAAILRTLRDMLR